MSFLKSFVKTFSSIHKALSLKTNHSWYNNFQNNHILVSRFTTIIDKVPFEAQENLENIPSSRFSKRKSQEIQFQSTPDSFRVTAYATAEEYKLENLKERLKREKFYKIQNLPEDASNVLYVEYSPLLACTQSTSFKNIFIFREGSIVFWNFKTDEKIQVLNMLKAFQRGSYSQGLILDQMETLDYTFTESTTQLVQGDIQLRDPSSPQHSQSLPLELYAFSNAMALSVKLAIWEASLDVYASSIEFLLEDLKNGRSLRISESEVLRRTGELFTLSHLINLSSDLMDTPDFYWDREHLEKLYHSTYLFLNVPRRTKVMNNKLRQCVEFMELLRDHLKDKHHTRLELMIIFLILIEVVYGSFHFYDKYYSEAIPATLKE